MSNSRRITLIAYLMYFFAGSSVILPGVLMGAVAHALGVVTADVGSAYSAAGLGMLLSIILSGWLVERIPMRVLILLNVSMLTGAILWMPFIDGMKAFGLSVFLVGLCAGIFIAVANILIVRLYDGSERSSKLIFLDFVFSFGALIFPIIAGKILMALASWELVYKCILVIALGVGFFSYFILFPTFDFSASRKNKKVKKYSCRDFMNMTIVTLACFCYTSSEVSFSFWIVEYLRGKFDVDIDVASISLSVFWVSIALGRLISSYAIKRVSFAKYILGSILIALVQYFFLFGAPNIQAAYVMISVLGLGYASLYPSIISHGTLVVKQSSARLVSLYLTGGTLGFMMGAALLSSLIKRFYGTEASLVVSMGFMGLVFVAMSFSFYLNRTEEKKVQEAAVCT